MDGRGEMGQGHLKAGLSGCLTEPEQIGFLLVCQKWDESDHLGPESPSSSLGRARAVGGYLRTLVIGRGLPRFGHHTQTHKSLFRWGTGNWREMTYADPT